MLSLPRLLPNHAEPATDTSSPQVTTVRVDATAGRETNSLIPDRALGSSIDVLPEGAVDKVYTDQILKESLSAGWGPITYRNNSELRMAAGHWNSSGTWSDVGHQAGYFTGSKEPGGSCCATPTPIRCLTEGPHATAAQKAASRG